jgi:hypothetical protein
VKSGFGVDNARLRAEASLMSVLRGVFEIDYGAAQGEVVYPPFSDVSRGTRAGRVVMDEHALRFLDAYLAWGPIDEVALWAGQFKVPFDLETRYDEDELIFSSTSLMTRRYLVFGDSPYLADDALYQGYGFETARASSFGRDLGVQVTGRVLGGKLNYGVGAFNGAGSNVENDNRDVLVSARLSSEIVGAMTQTMSDATETPRPLLSVGAGIGYDLKAHESQYDPFYDYNSSDISVTGDVLLKWMGASLLATFFFRHSDHGSALYVIEVDDAGNAYQRGKPIRALGGMTQLAYRHYKTGLEPAVRYSIFSARLDVRDDHVHEVTGALGYYAFKGHLKLLVESRVLLPADTMRSFLAPLSTWYDNLVEITLMAEVSF